MRPKSAAWVPVPRITDHLVNLSGVGVVLQLTHMETVPIRELQQHVSAVLRRVRRGETVGVTDRGTLVAVLSPVPEASGAAALVAAGRVRPATRNLDELPGPIRSTELSGTVLDDLRDDR
jgi:prevent-host-death family protein